MVVHKRLGASNVRGLGSVLGQRTRSHMLQLKVLHAAMKIRDPTPAARTQCSQINKLNIFLKIGGLIE